MTHKNRWLLQTPITPEAGAALAAQFMEDNLIALFEFEQTNEGIKVSSEKHYKLVKPDDLSPEELQSYSVRQS